MRAPALLALALALGCNKKDGASSDDTSHGSDDTGEPAGADDTAGGVEGGGTEGGGEEGGGTEGGGTEGGDEGGGEVPECHTAPLADLAPLSSGECPDLSASGTSTFLSSDEERKVTVLLPASGTTNAPVVFFFHGLTSPDATPEPTVYTADALGLQDVADALGAIIVLPESPLQDLFGVEFFLWNVVSGHEETDLALYDDLRTCVADALGADMERVSAIGFSGGALFTTVVATQRADTLSTFVELSGGADIDVFLFDEPVSAYTTPAWSVPSLLVSGGSSDVWPDASFVVVDFDEATDTLAADLEADGHYAVRCQHNAGHTITTPAYTFTVDWVSSHTYGEPSPYATDGIGSHTSWCEVIGG